MTAPAVLRKAVPLSEQDLATLSELRRPGSVWHQAFAEIVGEDAMRSESAVLQALVRLGIQSLEARALDAGYAALAASLSAEDQQFRSAQRRRRSARDERHA